MQVECLTRIPTHGQVLPRHQLEVLILAGGVEHGHLGLDGEDEALPVADPPALGVAPGGAGVRPEHIPLRVLHHQHRGALVLDPAAQLLAEEMGVKSWLLSGRSRLVIFCDLNLISPWIFFLSFKFK